MVYSECIMIGVAVWGLFVAPVTARAAPAEPVGGVISPDDIVFPADAGVIDVTESPYNVKGDGQTDVTAAIQKALDDHPNSNRIIYLPRGTYLISGTLRWPAGVHDGTECKRVILQGRSRDDTIIRLKDASDGFDDANEPRAMVWTGKAPAQRFRNGIRDLTVRTGSSNPGAIGIQYIANNQGSLRRVRIVCGDSGPIGLDLGYTNEQGPCLIQDVEVEGFDVGIAMRYSVDSITLERITVRGQHKIGVLNAGQCVSLRGLQSFNTVPAVRNEGDFSVMTLLDSRLLGPKRDGDGAAVVNSGVLFVRKLETSGYAMAVHDDAGRKINSAGPQVEEFTSHPALTLFGTTGKSLNLPIKETPRIPYGGLTDWNTRARAPCSWRTCVSA